MGELKTVIESAVARYVSELQGRENQLLVDIEADSLDRLLDRLDEPEPARVSMSVAFDEETLRTVPAPLLSFLPASLKDLPWKGVGRMLEEFRLSLARSDIKATLMRLRPGSQMPEHTHRGQEFTLLLAGGYRDSNKQFGPGDFDAKDSSQAHQPVVDDDGPCLAFAVLDAPLRLTGTMGKLINPFLRF